MQTTLVIAKMDDELACVTPNMAVDVMSTKFYIIFLTNSSTRSILCTLGSTNTDGQWLLLMYKKLMKSDQKVTNAVQFIVVLHVMVIGFMIL